jgi:hypothetical protein
MVSKLKKASLGTYSDHTTVIGPYILSHTNTVCLIHALLCSAVTMKSPDFNDGKFIGRAGLCHDCLCNTGNARIILVSDSCQGSMVEVIMVVQAHGVT